MHTVGSYGGICVPVQVTELSRQSVLKDHTHPTTMLWLQEAVVAVQTNRLQSIQAMNSTGKFLCSWEVVWMLKSSILWAQTNKVGPFREEATLRFGGKAGGGIQKTSCMAATRGDLMSGHFNSPLQPQGLPNKMLAYPGHAGVLHWMTSAQGRKHPPWLYCRLVSPLLCLGNLCASPPGRLWDNVGKGRLHWVRMVHSSDGFRSGCCLHCVLAKYLSQILPL